MPVVPAHVEAHEDEGTDRCTEDDDVGCQEEPDTQLLVVDALERPALGDLHLWCLELLAAELEQRNSEQDDPETGQSRIDDALRWCLGQGHEVTAMDARL